MQLTDTLLQNLRWVRGVGRQDGRDSQKTILRQDKPMLERVAEVQQLQLFEALVVPLDWNTPTGPGITGKRVGQHTRKAWQVCCSSPPDTHRGYRASA